MTALQEQLKKKRVKAIEYRKQKGMTLQEIAIELEVSMSTTQRWLKDVLRKKKKKSHHHH